jgi:alkanesulfonate monooxygenase SsuD/methylene tetrahydromethanopterin reductase-like flavin-dependent oxidoreductase (luciferase family)
MLLSVLSIADHYPDRERSVPSLYAEILEQGVFAEELGYHAFFVAEHHFHEYGAVPNPAVLLANLAARTRRLRLGTSISVLPFRNPVLVAEDYAMLDVISNGRLALGVGSGYLKHEFAGFGVDPSEKRERFEENLMLLERLLSGERVTHAGQFNRLDGIRLNIHQTQKKVPIYVATLRKDGAYYIGRQGRRIMSVPYATLGDFGQIGGLIEESIAAAAMPDCQMNIRMRPTFFSTPTSPTPMKRRGAMRQPLSTFTLRPVFMQRVPFTTISCAMDYRCLDRSTRSLQK